MRGSQTRDELLPKSCGCSTDLSKNIHTNGDMSEDVRGQIAEENTWTWQRSSNREMQVMWPSHRIKQYNRRYHDIRGLQGGQVRGYRRLTGPKMGYERRERIIWTSEWIRKKRQEIIWNSEETRKRKLSATQYTHTHTHKYIKPIRRAVGW
jgi:hypothetical protein